MATAMDKEKLGDGRRTHKKSRNGCLQCKTRKVKCDESKPVCNNCRRRTIQCHYALSHSAASSVVAAAPSGPEKVFVVSSPTAFPGGAVTPDSTGRLDEPALDLNMSQLELLHNYSTATCYTISRNPLLQTIWRVKVPQVGLGSDFAMRGILAISALHLAHHKPAQRDAYVAQANYYHDSALRAVTGILPNITKDNCEALYIFSALTSLISCAKPRKPGDFLLVGDRGISEWLHLFRGTRFIIDRADSILRAGPLGPMFSIGHRRVLMREAAVDRHPEQLVELRRLVESASVDPVALAVYNEALDELAKSFAVMYELGAQGFESADVFVWIFRVSEEYLELLGQRTPESLAIFAHFCVIMKHLEWAWWMEGWSAHLISVIYRVLDAEHRMWIQWPIEQLGFIP